MLVIVLGSSFFAGVTYAVGPYRGTGYFPTSNINRCYTGPATNVKGTSYSGTAQNAGAKWSATTNLNIFYNCSSWHVLNRVYDAGNTWWNGIAYICMAVDGCRLDEPLNWEYRSCEARINSRHTPQWDGTALQQLHTHEMGHCWSLAHVEDGTSVMKPGNYGVVEPNANDIASVNARYK